LVIISSEYSAQRRSHPINPMLEIALHERKELRVHAENLGKVADLGCGKLRHFDVLLPESKFLALVDTRMQLSRRHVESGKEYTVEEIAQAAHSEERKVKTYTLSRFVREAPAMDTIVCVAVFDVVPPEVRTQLLKAAARKLAREGVFILIIPRNDSSITNRFSEENGFEDGFLFHHHGLTTFFRNFGDYSDILAEADSFDLAVYRDFTKHRHVCLLFTRC